MMDGKPCGCGNTRRAFLGGGAGGLLGLVLAARRSPSLLAATATRPKAKSCILLWMAGGPSQFETFDPKPGAETGGPFKTIRTKVPGIHIGEHLPKVADQMKHLSIIRSMKTHEGSHWRGTYQVHTGYRPEESLTVQHPGLGSIVASEIGNNSSELPAFVGIGRTPLGGGFLGHRYNPFVVDDPMKSLEALYLKGGVGQERYARRMKLLEGLEKEFGRSRGSSETKPHRDIYAKASSMLQSQMTHTLDLSKEKPSVRQAYGAASRFGQGCLLARRLVEAGVPFIEVSMGGWDTHRDNFNRNRRLLGELDPAFSSLVRDLADRGLLEETLILWAGEFGRTPKINGRGGRDHYPRAWSMVAAGGGIRGGQIVGATDAKGVDVKDRPVAIQDIFATASTALGIDPAKTNLTPQGREIPVVQKDGKVIEELLS